MALDMSVPRSTLERLPAYLRAIDSLLSHDVMVAASPELAQRCGVSSAQFRKDMSLLGASAGTRGAGYDLPALQEELRHALGGTELIPFVIVGAGNLGSALASSSAFRRSGLDLVGLFDCADGRVGSRIAGLKVQHDRNLPEFVAESGVLIAVIAVPADAAQSIADVAVAAGVRELLNFSPAVLHVPETVEVRSVDLGLELQMLALRARARSGN